MENAGARMSECPLQELDARPHSGRAGPELRVMLVVLVALVGAYACDKTDALDLIRMASIEQNVGLYNVAVATWTKAIELGTLSKDDLATAYANRGTAYRDTRQYDRAMDDYNKAVELNPGDARAYVLRGTVHVLTEQYDRVIEDCSKAIELDPQYAMAYNNRGVAYQITREYDRAIEDFTEVIKLNPKDARAYYKRGNAYAEKRQYDRAIEDYNKAVELNPGDIIGYTYRGYAHIRSKQYRRAIEDYNKAIELNPQNLISYYNKACAYSLMNNPQESCRWLGIAVEKGYTDWNTIKNDSDFRNIRNAVCYKKLMMGK